MPALERRFSPVLEKRLAAIAQSDEQPLPAEKHRAASDIVGHRRFASDLYSAVMRCVRPGRNRIGAKMKSVAERAEQELQFHSCLHQRGSLRFKDPCMLA